MLAPPLVALLAMINFYLSPDNSTVVDATWYLENNSDVKAADIDPVTHYYQYGQFEGRYPRSLLAKTLEGKLWGGFTNSGLRELNKIVESPLSDSAEVTYAALAICRWHASRQEWFNAAAYIGHFANSPNFLKREGIFFLCAEIMYHIKSTAGLKKLVKLHTNEFADSNDFRLVASIYHHTLYPGQADDDLIKLDWINKVFKASSLVSISKKLGSADLTIDNLKIEKETILEKKQPLISILMPAFNAAKHIETAMQSVLAQTWCNIELIVVDDCSTDETIDIVSCIAASDARVKLIRQAVRQGAYAARNIALIQADGLFITNHDSDDWSHPQRLEVMVNSLTDNPGTVAVIADWVRTDPDLHFQRSRIDAGLIQPSVATIMFKKTVYEFLGGWDRVKVAADSEYLQRIVACFGGEAVQRVLPGTPLVFARHTPGSLTNSPATHLNTEYFGVRQLYQQMSQTWHEMAKKNNGLFMDPTITKRRFPAPFSNLHGEVSRLYDIALIADLSDISISAEPTKNLVKLLMSQGQKIGLFHWPDFELPKLSETSVHYLQLAVEHCLDIIAPDQNIQATTLLFLGAHLLKNPVDIIPKIHFQKSKIATAEYLINKYQDLDFSADPELRSSIEQSGFFSPDWYLCNNHDVKESNLDPLTHYLQFGSKEGREPGPDFNAAYYAMQYPQILNNGWPPLLHFSKIGRDACFSAGHPHLPGKIAPRKGKPTVLVCAHAAGTQLFGAERSLLDVLDSFFQLEINVLVSVPSLQNMTYISELQKRSLEVIPVFFSNWISKQSPNPWAIAKLMEAMQIYDIDFVHVNTIMQREPLLAAKQLGIPSVVHIHESPAHDNDLCISIGLSAENITDELLVAADNIFVNSEFTAHSFSRSNSPHIISNTFDENLFDIPNIVDEEKIYFSLISSNLPKKGITDIINIAKILESSTPQAKLLIIGPNNNFVAAAKSASGLPSNIEFIDYLSSPEAALKHTNVVLNLSHCQETFGRTVLEGMAASRPVIAYNWGALPEIIKNDYCGFLVRPLDINAVADKINWICNNPDSIDSFGKAGQLIAMERFSKNIMTQQLNEAYRNIFISSNIIKQWPGGTPKKQGQRNGTKKKSKRL